MTTRRHFALALLLALAAAIPARAASPELDKVLRQMDAAAANFHSAQADFAWDQLTLVVNSHDVQNGTVFFRRSGSTTQMAAQILKLNGREDLKTLAFDGHSLQLYQPRIKQLSVFAPGSNRGQFESFLTLGFGGSGRELEANWDITFAGYESLSDGAQSVRVARLDLVAKKESVHNMFSKVTIWVDPTRGVSLKQLFAEPSGDSRTALYVNIRVNQPVEAALKAATPIDPRDFRIKAPAGTSIVNH